MKTCATQNVKGLFQSPKDGDRIRTWSGEMSWNNVCALSSHLFQLRLLSGLPKPF